MTLDTRHPAIAGHLARLSPFGRHILEAAGRRALRLHADEVDPEHLLHEILLEEEGAAHRAILLAFSDPESIASEALALASGILVTGSTCTLPFSPRGVEALFAARERASRDGSAEVERHHLAAAATAALPEEVRADLLRAGWPAPPPADPAEPRGSIPLQGPLFRHYSPAARRILALSARLANGEGGDSIAPAHLVLGELEEGGGPADPAGPRPAAVRAALAGRTRDPSSPPPRRLSPSAELAGLLERLPEGAGSLELLAAFHSPRIPNLGRLLDRHKVGRAVLERSRGALADPDLPANPTLEGS